MIVDQSFEDLVRDTEQRDGTFTLWVLFRFWGLRDCDYQRSSPDFWNCDLVTRRKKGRHVARTSSRYQGGLKALGKWSQGPELYLVLNDGEQQQILLEKNLRRYSLHQEV